MSEWKVGDWAICDRRIVQIKEIRDRKVGSCSVSDGSIESSGHILDRLRPLTLQNKRIAEIFDYYYDELRKLRGNGGFNYPDIARHFDALMLKAIDTSAEEAVELVRDAQYFVRDARDYTPVIQGVHLFRE